MNNGKEFKLVKIVILIFTIFLFNMKSYAIQYLLEGIDVEKDTKNNYNVFVKLKGNAKIKKTINSDNSVALIVNSTVPSENIEINYDNASNIDNIVVRKKNTDNTVVVLEGENISNANIYIKNILTDTINPININSGLFEGNKGIIIFFITAFSMLLMRRRNKNNRKKIIKQKTVYQNQRMLLEGVSPGIVCKKAKGYISVPKDFTINRYLEDEKIKKAS